STTPTRESMRPSSNTSRNVGTIAAVPVMTLDSSSNRYSSASRPGMRTRDSAYDASAAAVTTSSIVPPASSTEFSNDGKAYRLSPTAAKLARVNSDGGRTAYVGVASNGAESSHSNGSAKNTVPIPT